MFLFFLHDGSSKKNRNITPQELIQEVAASIEKEGLLKAEYIEIVNSVNLKLISNWEEADGIQMCAAVYAGEVRLIDNIKLK